MAAKRHERTSARRAALQVLYTSEITDESPAAIAEGDRRLDESHRFVNGILGRIAKMLEGEEGQEADAPSSCDADAAGNEEPLAMRENEIAEPESEPLAAQKCGSPEQEGESPEGASSYGA